MAEEPPAEEGFVTEDEGEAGTSPKNKKMAKKTQGKGKRKQKKGSIVYMYPRKPPIGPSYSPCPHIYFKHPVVRRSVLNQKKYDELLATPKPMPWEEPEEELQKFRRRLLTPRTECLAMPPKRKMVAHLDEFSNVLPPQMVDNLEILLNTECKLPAEDLSKEKAKKKAAAKKAKKAKQAKKKAAVKKGVGAAGVKKGKAAGAAKKGKGAKAVVPPAEGETTEDEELEDEEEEGEEGAVEAEAAPEEAEGGVDTEAEEEAEAEGEAEGEGEGEGEDEGEEEAEAEEKELTESQLKLQETSRPVLEYAQWLEQSLSKATEWAGWIAGTVAEAEAKAAKKKGTVLAKDGTPKQLTCQEWNTWKEKLKTNVENWQSARKDILDSAKDWDQFMKIRAEKIKAGESFTVPNPQAYQESFGKFKSPRTSKA